MNNTRRVNVVLVGKDRKYFEEQKERLGKQKDSQALRDILDEHRKIMDIKY